MRKFPANSLEVFKNRIESSIQISFNKVLQRDKGPELHKSLKVPSSSNSFGFPNANCQSLPQITADLPLIPLNGREGKLLFYCHSSLWKLCLLSLSNNDIYIHEGGYCKEKTQHSWNVSPLLSHYNHTHNISDTKGVGGQTGVSTPANNTATTAECPTINSILMLLYLPWDSNTSHRIPQDCCPQAAQLQMPISSLSCHLCFSPTAINWKFPWPSPPAWLVC